LLLTQRTSSAQTTVVPCDGQIYRGFDSRLTGEILARIPEATKDFVGLEADGQQVFVASRDSVYVVDHGKVAVSRSTEPILAIAVDRQGDLLIQSQQTIRVIPRPPAKPFSAPVKAVTGRITGSGADSFLEIREGADHRTQLMIRRAADFEPLQFVTLEGNLGPLNWGPNGMAVILDGGIMVTREKDSSLAGVDRDTGFADATGIVPLPDGRVIVALKSFLVMTGGTGRLILAAISASVRSSGTTLIVFDRRTGFLWRVSGFESVGEAAADRRHADDLLTEWKKTGNRESALEAARILGCDVLSTR